MDRRLLVAIVPVAAFFMLAIILCFILMHRLHKDVCSFEKDGPKAVVTEECKDGRKKASP
ncbi:unnamed protein product [Arabis nemorensis]|uniref:Uncharacterized protein n=1 Tax=Arabis nemorensis TaxID=586526 RepID=A0A565BFC2_9BRAS|nr:unnamed protein product [Arabis nemorensis]